jgi:hypothetical protein
MLTGDVVVQNSYSVARMSDWENGIRSLEDAEAYFKAMGGSGFHMCREYPKRYEEYRELQVGEELERKWRGENLSRALSGLSVWGGTPADLWPEYVRAVDLLRNDCDPEAAARLLCVTEVLLGRFDDQGRLIAAESILGEGPKGHRAGLVQAFPSDPNLVVGYLTLAQKLIESVSDRGQRPRKEGAMRLLEGVRAETGRRKKRWW